MSRRFALDDEVVVVIGSGAGGGTLANGLARRGVDVVCLEAGRRLDWRKDFVNDEWTMFRRTAWLDPRTASGSWRVAKDFPELPAWVCKTVGGTTLHWAGASLRLQPHELRARTHYGAIEGADLVDWPFGIEELGPWYDEAERRMGVTRTNGIPPLPGNNNFKVLASGARRIGYRQVHTGRMAINSEPRDGRAACHQLGFCFQGCRYAAKWSTLYTEIPGAEATGHFELRPRCHALTIEHDARGRVSAVVYADASGRQHRQRARVVCVAGNALETPRLLLNSASSRFPDGLANGNGQVGRCYMRHVTGSVYARFERPVHMYRGTTMAGIVMDEAGHDPARGFAGGYELETISLGLPFLAVFLEPGAWGRRYTEWLEAYTHLAGLWIVGEDLPRADNRVTLHPRRRDAFGLPVADVHVDEHANDLAMRRHACRQAAAIYNAVGATQVKTVPPYPSTHNLGTCRMSTDPADGVCNAFGRAHEVPNLYISDGSQFPTSAAENPTLTIVALALRQAAHIAESLSKQDI